MSRWVQHLSGQGEDGELQLERRVLFQLGSEE